jgi:hypothetical protein
MLIFTVEQVTKAQRAVEIWPYYFFNLDAGYGWVINAKPGPLYPRERTGTLCLGDCVDPHVRSGRVRKISPPYSFDSRTLQAIPSRYTD